MSDESVRKADDVVEKWGRDVAGAGFSQVPNYLLRFNQFTSDDDRLSPTELLLLIELAGTWWKKDDLPFPSMKTLAVRCGTSERQILRAVKRLESIGLLKRVNRKKKGIIASNAYDLSPLVEVLQVVAETYPPERRRKLRDEVDAEGKS